MRQFIIILYLNTMEWDPFGYQGSKFRDLRYEKFRKVSCFRNQLQLIE